MIKNEKSANIHIQNQDGNDVYFKYTRESDRLDRVGVYLKNQENVY
ncbi:MAG TPA: hypothetical protein IAD08_02785 [Candidatus Scatovivens faecipullorum]|nr:hypothetical protein [Candidatus Scatovivens faecipullorum]